jgi:hypothetical protein
MVFVELTPFLRFREQHWTDEELRGLQRFLLVTPTAGDVIRGTRVGCGSCAGPLRGAANAAEPG